jgi:hypothetical protein
MKTSGGLPSPPLTYARCCPSAVAVRDEGVVVPDVGSLRNGNVTRRTCGDGAQAIKRGQRRKRGHYSLASTLFNRSVRSLDGRLKRGLAVTHRPLIASSATRSPVRTAPSMKPVHRVAVSVPAQWIRPTGRRSAWPSVVSTPGFCVLNQSGYSVELSYRGG